MIVLVFLKIFLWLSAVSSKDFIVTNFGNNELLKFDETFAINKSYKMILEQTIYQFQAKYLNNKLMLAYVEENGFETRYIDEQTFFYPTEFKFDGDVSMFDVQTHGDSLVTSSIKDGKYSISLASFVDSNVETVLTSITSLQTLAIHPTLRIIYYETCQGSILSLKVYEADLKQELNNYVPPICLDHFQYDEKNDVLWAFYGNQVYKCDLKSEKFEVIYGNDKAGVISSMSLGNEDLFIMHESKRRPSVYNLKLVPKSQRQLTLRQYKITPVIGFLPHDRFFLLDIDKEQLVFYDKNFNIMRIIAINIEKKMITSLKYFVNRQKDIELYWIHSSNGGYVERTVINSVGDVTRKTFRFLVEEIVDFVVFEKPITNTIFFAVNTSIHSGFLEDTPEKQNISIFFDLEKPIKAMDKSKYVQLLYVSVCNEKDNGYVVIPILNLGPRKYDSVECFESINNDDDSDYFLSATGIYRVEKFMTNFEKLYEVSNLKNIAVDDNNVYFVSSDLDSQPGIYTIPKILSRRAWTPLVYYDKQSFITEIKGEINRDGEEVVTNGDKSTNTTNEDEKSTLIITTSGVPPSPKSGSTPSKNSMSSFFAWSIYRIACFVFTASVAILIH